MPIAPPDVFTLEAANALVPRLSEVVGKQLSRRAGIESRLKALCDLTGKSPDELGPQADDDANLR